MSIYFTSDTHFSHFNIIKYCSRPFNNIYEMNEELIKNWNNIVSKNDTIYHLGDFGFGKYDDMLNIFKRLNGKNKILIKGNHDKDCVKLPWDFTYDMFNLKYNEFNFHLCHYPLRSWNLSSRGGMCLHGHSHNTLPGLGRSCDVGVDAQNFKPVSIEELKQKLSKIDIHNKSGD